MHKLSYLHPRFSSQERGPLLKKIEKKYYFQIYTYKYEEEHIDSGVKIFRIT